MSSLRASPGRLVALLVSTALAASCACGPGDPLEAARALQAEGRFEASIEPLAELVEQRRDDAEVHYLYGLALARTGRSSEAVWPLRRAMENAEWKVAAGLQLGAGALQTGNFDEAVAVVSEVLELEPDNTSALLLRTMARVFTRRDYEGALADADRLLELEPENEYVLPHRAVALLGLDRTEEASQALDELEEGATEGLVPGPYAPGFCGARAKFAEESGELDKAERLYRSCLEQFPTNGLVLREAVEFFDATGKRDEATALLRDAHEAVPRDRDLRFSLAARLQRLGDVAGAEALLRDATTDAHPLIAVNAYADLARFLSDHERFEEAIESYEAALALVPQARERLLFPFADTLVRAGEPDRALELAADIPVPAYRHLIRGRALLAKDDAEQALEALSQGLALWPNQPIGRFYAAVAAERLGDFDRAIEEYRYAIRAGALLEARLRLARLHQALGEPQRALTALRHNPGKGRLGVEAALLELELLSSVSRSVPANLRPELVDPALRSRVIEALAAGVRQRAGPAVAAQVVLEAKRLDLALPASAPVLAGLVDDLCSAERPEHALTLLDRLLQRAPEAPELVALRADALECAGRTQEAAAGYTYALELEPGQARALLGRARHAAAAGETQAALADYQRAAALQSGTDDASATLAAAELLAGDGRAAEAIQTLEQWLASHTLDAQAMLRLAALLAEEPEGAERAARLVARAGRLGAASPEESPAQATGAEPETTPPPEDPANAASG